MTNPPLEPEGRNITHTPDARRRAAIAGHEGDHDTAIALLDDDNPGVRAAALNALARMGRVEQQQLERALTDPAALVRRRALAVAAEASFDVDLRPLLGDADPMVAEQAAWALGELGDVAAVDALVRAAVHADALVREAAVAALGALGDERGRATILAATEDKPAIRRRAVLALAPFDGPDVDAALARAAEDADWQVRDAADVILDARGAAPQGGR